MRKRPFSIPRPFLKWVGGKGQLLGELLARVDRATPFTRYHEPFIGGGALYFELFRRGRLDGVTAHLSDTNARLIEAYQWVQQDVEKIIKLLHVHQGKHGKEHYYATRAKVPGEGAARAARIIYLNKTCYNGLYRENSLGLFNVPMGSYKDPLICDEENLRAVSKALEHALIEQRHFRTILDTASPGDLVYFDPPYHPINPTSNFTAYDQQNFREEDQVELADTCRMLHQRGVQIILSNSFTPFITELYRSRDFKYIEEVLANRMVNSKAERRGKISETIVHNLAPRPGRPKHRA